MKNFSSLFGCHLLQFCKARNKEFLIYLFYVTLFLLANFSYLISLRLWREKLDFEGSTFENQDTPVLCQTALEVVSSHGARWNLLSSISVVAAGRMSTSKKTFPSNGQIPFRRKPLTAVRMLAAMRLAPRRNWQFPNEWSLFLPYAGVSFVPPRIQTTRSWSLCLQCGRKQSNITPFSHTILMNCKLYVWDLRLSSRSTGELLRIPRTWNWVQKKRPRNQSCLIYVGWSFNSGTDFFFGKL